MARICTGCGFSADSDGNLTIDGQHVWKDDFSNAACVENAGMAIYCDAATGRLHGPPEHTSRVALDLTPAQVAAIPGATLGQVDGLRRTTNYNDLAIPTTRLDVDTFTLPLQNPSACRSASVVVTIDFEVEIDLTAGAEVFMSISTDKVWDFRNRSANTIAGLTWQQSRTYTMILAPGQLFNFTRAIQLTASPSNGSTYHRSQWIANWVITTR